MAFPSGGEFTKEFIKNFAGCGAELPVRWCLWVDQSIDLDWGKLAITDNPLLYSEGWNSRGGYSREGCGFHGVGYVRVCESCMRKLGLLW